VTEPLPKPWTVDDFLEWEAQQPERYEFIDGRILGMVGGSAAHATIKGNVFAVLRPRGRSLPRLRRKPEGRNRRREPLSGRGGDLRTGSA
jgi:Uma2 family endonuclease